MIGAIVDTEALLKVVLASLVGGVGVSVVFALAVYGAARSGDMRRAERGAAATVFAFLAVAGVAVVVAAIAYGLVLMLDKS